MAKNTVPIIIVGAVVFGLLAIGLTLYSVFNNAAPAPQQQNNVAAQPVAAKHYIAMRPIYPRTIVTSDMIRESENNNGVEASAITNLSDIVGKLASRTIQAGQVITADKLTLAVARVIPANIPVPLGLRAVAIWVDPAQTAAGLVDAGDRVDVIVTHELTLEKIGNQVVVGSAAVTAGRTIAQDIEVLAVDKSIAEVRPVAPPATAGQGDQAGAPAAGAPAPAATPPPAPPQPGQVQRIRVILAVAPEIAQRLVAANSKGQLHITIRNPNSRERFPQPEVREYPSRIAAGPPTPRASTPAAGNTNNNRNNGGGERLYPPAPTPDLSIPSPNTIITPGAIRNFPPVAPEKDVTVIRGTEKTRVIVPR